MTIEPIFSFFDHDYPGKRNVSAPLVSLRSFSTVTARL
jgi:hypothetical protein